jgi:hypothetical protein
MRGGWRGRIKVAAQNGMAFSRAVVELKELELVGEECVGAKVLPHLYVIFDWQFNIAC